MRKQLSYLLLFCFWVIHDQPFYAQIDITYQTPPEEISRLIDAPATPRVEIGPDKNIMLIIERPGLSSVEQVAQPELRIAGLRINPGTNGSSRSSYFTAMKVQRVSQDEEKLITGIPNDAVIRNVEWSPDGKKIAFTLTKKDGIELWMASIESLQSKKLTEKMVNDAIGDAYYWFSDSESILYQSIPVERGVPPEKNLVPEGPIVSENLGTKAAVRTFQDLLKNRYDEELFDYYTTSQICITDLEGNSKPLGEQCIVKNIMPSPDGKYILVEKIQHPYSYLVPYYRFPSRVEVWDRTGKIVKTVAEIPLSEDIPKGFDAVRKGPRSFSWRADVPATLVWVEALDEGDPSKEAAYRDQVFYLKAPFSEKAVPAVKTQLRFADIIWGTDEVAVLHEFWWSNRRVVTSRIRPGQPTADKEVWFDRSFEDAYNDPGNFQTVENIYGRNVLLMGGKNKTLFLTGEGASPEGNRPFLDQFDVAKKSTKRLWQSEAPYYEFIKEVMDPQKRVVLTSRESKEEQPNYYVRELKSGGLTQITTFPHPYPSLKNLSGELIIYTREDGVQLTGKLYLPPGYKKDDGTLPVLMWAYPREFKDASLAGQVTDSPYRFLYLGRYSPVMWVTQGYAVFDDLGMPIIGEGDEEPNDSFVSQLVANGKAAIDKLVEMGVADPNRVAVGGHSYGAFMTANLLAHSDLFAAGIARSGAYNRTLTPFGFQAEERTFWEAPEVYFRMSPFMHAHKIKEPILLIHGEADNNSGTFPMQSERFYSALKGHGGTVRLVMLPHESHGYRGKESIMHMAWEMNRWLEEYVKNKK